MRSGVPQGSVLCPLLFLIVVSDIDCALTAASASFFADDTRIIINISTDEDAQVKQNDLDKIYDWANLNAMVFNNSKFEHLKYVSHVPYGVQRQFTTKKGIVIGKPEVVKDLGVFMCKEKDATFI